MDRYRIEPGTQVSLADFDTADNSQFDTTKKESYGLLDSLRQRLSELQRLLYAENKRRILIILQALDTGGKDGTIRHVFSGVDHHGIRVTSFKKPSATELERDYLWRIHQRVPPLGDFGIFNRSHYEDIIAVRVKKIAPPAVWKKRYQHVVDFERMLADENTVILKFFLHISKKEQRERLRTRLADPTKHWKFNRDDLEDRGRWPDFVAAYEDVITKTSRDYAPWFVIPADRKWYRNLTVATIVKDALESLDMSYPLPDFDPASVDVE